MLCEKCQKHEATVHTTNVNGEEVSTVNLCEDCFRAAEPRRAEEIFSAWKAGCFYCGGEPDRAAPDLSVEGGKEENVVLCKPCGEEFYSYWEKNRPLRRSQPGATRSLAETLADLHEHMKRWVAERG